MENHQQIDVPASIGGEPLAGSGFEADEPIVDDEVAIENLPEEPEVEKQ
jgi:hypothetical protein